MGRGWTTGLDRSNSRKSMAFSCGDRSVVVQPLGNGVPAADESPPGPEVAWICRYRVRALAKGCAEVIEGILALDEIRRGHGGQNAMGGRWMESGGAGQMFEAGRFGRHGESV